MASNTPKQLRYMNMDALTTHLANTYTAYSYAKTAGERKRLTEEAERTKNAINNLRMEAYV